MTSLAAPWFHVPHLPAVGEAAVLDRAEAKHLHVRRKREGDTVVLFDGAGRLAVADIVESATRRGTILNVARIDEQPPLTPPVHLASALPKGDRLSTMISMAVQVGMTTFTALDAERSVVRPQPGRADAPDDRLLRLCVESCKQSRRAWLPVLGPPCTPAELASDLRGGGLCVVAHPGGEAFATWWRARRRSDAALRDGVTIVIGPEGGFTGGEVDGLREAGAVTVDLGSGILRIETAAVAMLSAIRLTVGRRK